MDVCGRDVGVNEIFGLQMAECVQKWPDHVARFGSGERAIRNHLREIFFGEFQNHVKKIHPGKPAAAGIQNPQEIWMRKF